MLHHGRRAKDCVYYAVRAWGAHDRSYLIRYGIVASLDDLAALQNDRYRSPAGEFAATAKFVDSGYRTDEVYQFCQKHGWIPTKGHDTSQQSYPVKPMNGVLHVNVDYFKEHLQLRFKIANADPGAWLLPKEAEREFASHLASEGQVVEIDKWGRQRRRWKLVGSENHWLDCEVMQLAGAHYANVRFRQEQQRTSALHPLAADFLLSRWGQLDQTPPP